MPVCGNDNSMDSVASVEHPSEPQIYCSLSRALNMHPKRLFIFKSLWFSINNNIILFKIAATTLYLSVCVRVCLAACVRESLRAPLHVCEREGEKIIREPGS